MSSALWTITLVAALGQAPIAPPVDAMGGVMGGTEEPLYQFDAYDNWVHGYFQEIPAYGGYHYFRPYNYKHVLSQSQVAGGWGMSPNMPYSHEYFRRFREHAAVDRRPAGADGAYAAEMARLRAQYDFQRSQVERARHEASGAQPAAYERPAPDRAAYERPGYGQPAYDRSAYDQRGVEPLPLNQERSSRIDELQERIRRQAFELQELERSLQEEQSRGAPPRQPVQNMGYRSSAGGR